MQVRVFLLFTVLLGLILRMWGIEFGLPAKYRPDEEYIVGAAIKVITGDWNPRFFIYPAFYFELSGKILHLTGFLLGLGDAAAIADYFGGNGASAAYLAIRRISACLGALCIFAVYFVARDLRSELSRDGRAQIGALAALFLALNYLHTRESHFATTDSAATLFVTLTLLAAGWIVRGRSVTSALIGGALVGLSGATKYPAFVVGASVGIALFLSHLRSGTFFSWRMVGRALIIGVAAIVVFASTNPYLLLETEKVAEDFEYQSYWVREGLPGIQMDFGWRWLFLFALRYGAGLGVCAFALVGAWALLKRQNPTGAQSPNASLFAKLHSYFSGRETFWCCLVIVVLMSIPLLRSKLLFFRYVLLFMPVLCAFAAVGVDEMARRVPAAWRSSMLLGGVAVCILDPAIRISRTGFLLSELDTRTEAKQWIEEHIPPNTPLGSHSTYYYGKPQLAYGYSFPDARLAECGSNPNECLEWVIIDEHPVRMFSPELTPEEKSALATRYDRVYDVHPVREGGYRTGLYDPSDAFYVPIASGADVIRPGTTLSIYRRKGGVGTR